MIKRRNIISRSQKFILMNKISFSSLTKAAEISLIKTDCIY